MTIAPDRGAGITFGALAFLAVALAACDRGRAVTQPIAFNHKAHVDSGLDCAFCHETVEKAPHAGVPAIETCMECHADASAEPGTEVAKLQGYGARGASVPWRRIYDLPDHVYFSHRRHVTVARIECVQCHGDVSALTAPAPRPLVDHDMGWCLSCHVARGASTDCIHCHR